MTASIDGLAILTNTRRLSSFELAPDPDTTDEWLPIPLADDTLAYVYHGSDPLPRDLVGTTIQAWATTPPEDGEPLSWKMKVTEVLTRRDDDIIVRADIIPGSLDPAVPVLP